MATVSSRSRRSTRCHGRPGRRPTYRCSSTSTTPYRRWTTCIGHRRRAEELGAELLYDRTGVESEPLHVLADPAGHPFCLLVGVL
ncbi:VOC family protein [Kribbella capetownensis]|uniref:VOC family protein n=1 Tax=Kribbella capetownensis TaxID=1572659 RepID=UPI001EDFA4E8|nr:VOC family protein [Kribbella capetownensis]